MKQLQPSLTVLVIAVPKLFCILMSDSITLLFWPVISLCLLLSKAQDELLVLGIFHITVAAIRSINGKQPLSLFCNPVFFKDDGV